jgi:glycosyltransferase involved in cell wall biosynthesis
VSLSVVVPLYNKARYIRRALDSIANQTFGDFEVIVVNDGSTDGGEKVAASYPDDRFRVITQENQGPGAARNAGIAQAKGELIAFLDADDEWLPHHLKTAVSAFQEHDPKLAVFCAGYIECPAELSTEPMWRRRGIKDGLVAIDASTQPDRLHYMLAYMTPCASVARTAIVLKWGGFYEDRCKFGEDSFLWLKILFNETVFFQLQPSVRVHREAGDLSQNLGRARPIEPLLSNPDEIEKVCPQHLLSLLHRFLDMRAFKTACVWGYWGMWREARSIRAKFRTQGDFRLPYYWSSWVCSTPVGAMLGAAVRAIAGVRNRKGRAPVAA